MNRRKNRSKEEIEQSITNAAVSLIENKGFLRLAVTAICKEAQIEPITFYNRHEGVSEFMDEFVKRYDYWFSDIAKTCSTEKDKKEKYLALMRTLFKSFKENKCMQQLLRWELSEQNGTTVRTACLREVHTLPLVKEYRDLFSDASVDVAAVSSLIIGGIYYIILHSGLSPFSGIDINTEEGEKRIYNAIEYLSSKLFSELSVSRELMEVIQKMKKNNISLDIIADCTGVSIATINAIR